MPARMNNDGESLEKRVAIALSITEKMKSDLSGLQFFIVGSGLIGTSIGLALKDAGITPTFLDLDSQSALIANQLVGHNMDQTSGVALKSDFIINLSEAEPSLLNTNVDQNKTQKGRERAIFIVATEPRSVFEVIKGLGMKNESSWFIEVSGIKSNLEVELKAFSDISARTLFVHPMAGREVSGVQAARGDLFQGRNWVVLPRDENPAALIILGKDLGALLGSSVTERSVIEHDEAVTLVSQLPQLLSTALASTLIGREGEVELAGGGLRDLTRLADSPAKMWSALFLQNGDLLSKELKRFIDKLTSVLGSLERKDEKALLDFLQTGAKGRELIPGKHGGKSRNYWFVVVVIDDRPGQLELIVKACSENQVNIEDIVIEHSPGQETGLISLALQENDAKKLNDYLLRNNWRSHLLLPS
jgi:prephenate dehydrogenase